MLGFLFGTICLIGLVKVVKAGLRGDCGPCGSGYGYGGRYATEPPFARRRRFGERVMLRSLFERLETTPGQEKAIVKALDELRATREVAREELKRSRADVARIMTGGLVDEHAFEDTFARHDRALAELRVTFVEALRVTAEALDDRQRRLLGDLLAGGRWGRGVGFGRRGQEWDGAWL